MRLMAAAGLIFGFLSWMGLLPLVQPFGLLSATAQPASATAQRTLATDLLQQGNYQYRARQFSAALQSWQRSLALFSAIKDGSGMRTALVSLGDVSSQLSRYEQAVDYYEQALTITQAPRDRSDEAGVLNNLGTAYRHLSNYRQAIATFEKALTLYTLAENSDQVATVLTNLGNTYWSLGDYPEAFRHHRRALFIFRAAANPHREAYALNNLGNVYWSRQNYQQAIVYYEQALSPLRATQDFNGLARVFNNLGSAYQGLSNQSQAIRYHQLALLLFQAIRNREGEAVALTRLGNTYLSLADYPQAIAHYQQALPIFQATGDRAGEALVRSRLGNWFALQNQPALAIVFYKASINIREQIRGELRELPVHLQQSFTNAIASDYRALADLLLQQNRILEARRILDLLKVQELDDYLQDVQRSAATASGIDYWQPEQQILDLYQQVIVEAEELAWLAARLHDGGLTVAERERLSTLQSRQAQLQSSFFKFLDSAEVVAALNQLRVSTAGHNLELENYQTLQRNLQRLPQSTVLLYPLILENRLELVLVTANTPPIRYPVKIAAAELNRAIVELGQALADKNSDVQPSAHRLYQWLIEPLEAELTAAAAEMIIFAPDGALRYVPLAALHDGDRWLTERFRFTHITAASLTNFDAAPLADLQVLAAACAECRFNFTVPEVGGREFQFDHLPHTAAEVAALAAQLGNVDVLLNQSFNPADLKQRLGGYNVLHLATHAAFVQGEPRESFIVFGSGETVSLQDIRYEWQFSNIELVVLSACETALGSTELGSGVEILGLGYQMQNAGAKAAIASLWKVSDGGTQVLMNAFYAALAAGQTKAEALQTAQQALISGNFSTFSGDRAEVILTSRSALPPAVSHRLSHPYYWAPFILIGNGL
ncbi:MAG: CHAT domain-containing protein [Leptolyngbya sp. SIO4C5]|nr:CHAT domain-containing protein [Leptolyngbya sp. SIO4C5]